MNDRVMYEELEIEVIHYSEEDILTSSTCQWDLPRDDS